MVRLETERADRAPKTIRGMGQNGSLKIEQFELKGLTEVTLTDFRNPKVTDVSFFP